jgi:hypothetical protein
MQQNSTKFRLGNIWQATYQGDVMFKAFIIAGVIAACFITQAQATENRDLKHFSLTINATPSLQSAANSDVPGTEKISDSSYQYQANYNHRLLDWHKGLFEQRLEYYALRTFAYRYTLVDGLGSLQGVALFYGQRYLTDSNGYQGFGMGWHAGVASVTDTRVQKCCVSPSSDDIFLPIVAGEAFYRFNVTPNVFVETNLTLTWRSNGETVYYATPALIVGAQF